MRLGGKAHHDPRLHNDMADLTLELDATDWHPYAAEWGTQRVRFFVDDRLVRTVDQGLDYPLQRMVSLFQFPADGDRDPARYPKSARVCAVRGYRPR